MANAITGRRCYEVMIIDTKVFQSLMLALIVILSYGSVVANEYKLDESRHVTVVAVSTSANGSYVGVSADLYVRVVYPGNGHVYVETLPLSQLDLQASTRIAALVASYIAGVNFNHYDFYASIKANTTIIGGPSASGVTAVAFAAALLRLPLNGSVVMTGMIMPDGSIGPVGGIKYKLDAAYSRGAKLFIVPYGQTVDYIQRVVTERIGPLIITRTVREAINLSEYGARIGVKVVPVTNVYEALEIFTDGRYSVRIKDSDTGVASRIYSSIKYVVENWVKKLKDEIADVMNKSKEVEEEALARAKSMYTLYTYRYLLGLLNSIDNNIDNLSREAEYMVSKDSFYSAASMYFQVLTYAYTRLYLLNTIQDPNFVKSFGSSLNNSIYEFIDNIRQKTISSKAELSVAINVLDRAYEAAIYVNRSLRASDIESAVNYLAYASARLYTAKLWSELANVTDIYNGAIDLYNIRTMAMYIHILAQNIYAYIMAFSTSLINLPTVLDDVEARYNLLQKTDNDLDKLTLGISSISYMYLTLVSMFIQSMEATIYTLNRTLHMNLNMLGNYIPIDAPLYIEIIENLKENPYSQITMLTKLSMILTIYRSIILITENKTITSTIGIETATQTPMDETIRTITKTITITHTITVTQEKPVYGKEHGTVSTTTVNLSDVAVSLIIIVVTVALAILVAIAIRFIGRKDYQYTI